MQPSSNPFISHGITSTRLWMRGTVHDCFNIISYIHANLCKCLFQISTSWIPPPLVFLPSSLLDRSSGSPSSSSLASFEGKGKCHLVITTGIYLELLFLPSIPFFSSDLEVAWTWTWMMSFRCLWL